MKITVHFPKEQGANKYFHFNQNERNLDSYTISDATADTEQYILHVVY